MISYIKAKNFKSYAEVMFDLRGTHNKPKNTAFVYGENGSGKTNLMEIFAFLSATFKLRKFKDPFVDLCNNTLDSEEKKLKYISQFNANALGRLLEILTKSDKLSDLIAEYRRIGSKGPLEIEIGFNLNGFDGVYKIVCNEKSIIGEDLRYLINKRSGKYFTLNLEKHELNDSIFKGVKYKTELIEEIKKYWGEHTFLSILFEQLESKNRSYISEHVNSSLLVILEWFQMWMVFLYGRAKTLVSSHFFEYFNSFDRGVLEEKDKKRFLLYQDSINSFFTSLYSDVKKAYYKFGKNRDQTTYKLYFKKYVGGKLTDIPFEEESSGTKKLLELLPLFISYFLGYTVIIDEMDTGIHDLLFCELIQELSHNSRGQMIATSHNTFVMDALPTDSVYIINSDVHGNKNINCAADFEPRIQKNHSLSSLYYKGRFSGIPNISSLDFDELAEMTQAGKAK